MTLDGYLNGKGRNGSEREIINYRSAAKRRSAKGVIVKGALYAPVGQEKRIVPAAIGELWTGRGEIRYDRLGDQRIPMPFFIMGRLVRRAAVKMGISCTGPEDQILQIGL